MAISSEQGREAGFCFVKEHPDCKDCPLCGATFHLDPMPRAVETWQSRQLFWWLLCAGAIASALVSAVVGWPL